MNVLSTSTPTSPVRRALTMIAAAAIALTGAVVAQTAVAEPAHAAVTTFTHDSGATVTYDTEVKAGEPIVLSGTGWMTKPDFVSDVYEVEEGNEGSIIGVKFFGPNGTVARNPKPDNPYTGDASYSSPDVWEIIQGAGTGEWWSGAAPGSWQVEIPWPSAENGAVTPVDLQPGQTFGLQFLTGTLYGGDLVGVDPNSRPDVSRTFQLTFTVADEAPVGEAPAIAAGEAPAATVGAAYEFQVPGSGDPAPEYSVVAGGLPAGLLLDPATGLISGTPTEAATAAFTVQAANGLEPAATREYTIAVTAAPAPLTVAAHPELASVASGTQVSFSAESAGGTAPVTVQWQRSTTFHASVAPTAFTNVTAAQAVAGSQVEPTLVVNAGTSPHLNNRWYRAVFTDAGGNTVTTDAARLSIVPTPAVTVDPVGQTIEQGATASFSVTGTGQDSVQWQSTTIALSNGEPDDATWAPVAGATGETLSITGTDADAQHGTFYRAALTNVSGTTYSRAAQLRFFEKLDTTGSVEVSGQTYGPAGADQKTVSVKGPNAVVHGEDIVIEGYNYLAVDGQQGSVAMVLVDAAYSGDPLTVNTTRAILHPQTGATISDKRGHNVVQAGGVGAENVGKQTVVGEGGASVLQNNPDWAPGYFRVVVPWPDETNTVKDADFFAENWSAGSQHTVRFLTGTLKEPAGSDYQSGITYRFTVVDEPTAEPAIAPEVTTQPVNSTVEADESATFTAAASGTPAPTVQWESSTDSGTTWAPIAGATGTTLTVADTEVTQTATRYRAVFTNAGGSATSNAAGLAVTPVQDPAFTYTVALRNGFPAGVLITSKEVQVGAPITVSGTGWFKQDGTGGSGGPIFLNQPSGGTGPVNVSGRTIENQIPGSTFADARAHGVFQSDASGSWTLTFPFPTPDNSTLTAETAWQAGQAQTFRILTGSLVDGDHPRSVAAGFELVAAPSTDVAPEVRTQPASVSVVAGTSASFTAAASGDPAPTVQWESSANGTDWIPVAGATDATLTLANTTVLQSGTQYRAVFTNSAGTATSDAATLTVTAPEPQDPALNYTQVTSNTTSQPAGTLITPKEVKVGEPITISGTGWFLQNGEGGSAGPIFINQPNGGTGPVNVSGRTIENQIPGSNYADARAHGVWQSDDAGNWSITIPFPTPENSTLTEETAWKAGDTQRIRILTGSLATGDHSRNPFVDFEVVAGDEEPPAEPTGEIALTNNEVEQYGDVWFNLAEFTQGTPVTVELANSEGEVVASKPFTIGADGNTANPDGQTYRKVRVPRDATPGAYVVQVRALGEVVATSGPVTVTAATTRVFNPGDHAGGEEDMLVQRGGTWTFHAVGFEPSGKLTATAEVEGETVMLSGLGQIGGGELAWQLDANGDTLREPVFNRVQIPSSVEAGDFEITFSDGTNTVTRTVTVEVPTEASATVDQSAELGGMIRVAGTGFMHPNGNEGSKIAIKINDGAYSRVDTSLHQNKTIWWIVEADEFGSFSIDMPMPNGTMADDGETLGSNPALVPGDGFTLRFLTGSLKEGDLSRSLQSTPFEVTAHSVEPEGPVIVTQPQDASLTIETGTHRIAACVNDATSATWQWLKPGESEWSNVTPVDDASVYSRYQTYLMDAGTFEECSTSGADQGAVLILRPSRDGAEFPSGTQFRVVLTGENGTTTSDAATITHDLEPWTPITYTQHPQDATAQVGDTVTFTSATESYPVATNVRWQYKTPGDDTWWMFTDLSTHQATLTLENLTLEQSGLQVRAQYYRAMDGVYSDPATLTVTEAPVAVAPVITTQPSSQTVVAGQGASFTAAASGDPAPTVQWESSTDGTSWAPVAGATETTLVLGTTAVSHSGMQYRAVFTNGAGSATTEAATLTVTPTPVDPTDPTDPTDPSNPQPDFTPESPADSSDELPVELEDAVTVAQNGNSAIVTVPGAEEGEWFFVYAYSTPTPLGWHQTDANSRFTVDLSSLSPGEHTLAVLDAEGQLVGWSTITLGGPDAETPAPGGKQPVPGSQQPVGVKHPSGTAVTGAESAMPLAALGALLLLAGGVAIAGVARRRASAGGE